MRLSEESLLQDIEFINIIYVDTLNPAPLLGFRPISQRATRQFHQQNYPQSLCVQKKSFSESQLEKSHWVPNGPRVARQQIMAIARVALDCPVDSLFDYRSNGQGLVPGQLVVVPFGRRRQVGLVLDVADHSQITDARLRIIESIVPVGPLPADTLALIRFSSEYYQCPIGQAAFVALPAALRRVRYVAPEPQWQYVLTAAGKELSPDQFPARAIVKRRLLEALRSTHGAPPRRSTRDVCACGGTGGVVGAGGMGGKA